MPTQDSRPNLLLITTDQQRFDTIAAAGNTAILTPHLDWLCDEGIRFSRSYTDCPICVPARATIMTGTHGWNLNLTTNNDRGHCMAGRATLPGELTHAGYQTRATGKMHFAPPRAHYGFEHMEILEDYYRGMARSGGEPPLNHGIGQNEMHPVFSTCEESRTLTNWTVDRSIDFLETRDETRPFFLWTSFSNPHPPFDPPKSVWDLYEGIPTPEPAQADWSDHPTEALSAWRLYTWQLSSADRFTHEQWQAVRRAYYACITHIDYSLGRLFARLRELSLLDNTWIIFTSDHGEMLGDHHLAAKAQFLEGAAHVPLMIRPPASATAYDPQRGSTDHRLACLADLLPTFLNLATPGITSTPGNGLDLLGESTRETLFGECGHFHMILQNEWKYQFCTQGGGELLFNLKDDPAECHNLADSSAHAEIRARLNEQLVTHLKTHQRPALTEGQLKSVEPPRSEQEARARAWRGFHTHHERSDVLH